jgi:hypothetical protein
MYSRLKYYSFHDHYETHKLWIHTVIIDSTSSSSAQNSRILDTAGMICRWCHFLKTTFSFFTLPSFYYSVLTVHRLLWKIQLRDYYNRKILWLFYNIIRYWDGICFSFYTTPHLLPIDLYLHPHALIFNISTFFFAVGRIDRMGSSVDIRFHVWISFFFLFPSIVIISMQIYCISIIGFLVSNYNSNYFPIYTYRMRMQNIFKLVTMATHTFLLLVVLPSLAGAGEDVNIFYCKKSSPSLNSMQWSIECLPTG